MDRAVKTYKVCGGATGAAAKGAPPIQRIEVFPISPKIRDRRAGKYKSLPKAKTGIPIYKHMYNDIKLVDNLVLMLKYMHQLSWQAYMYGHKEPDTVRTAKRLYGLLGRKLSRWNSVLVHSINVRRYWNVISMLMRFTHQATKLRGRPLCGNDRDNPLGYQPNALGPRIKVLAFFSEESSMSSECA